MRCPRCHHQEFKTPCPACGFDGDPALLETFSNLNFLLEQLKTWQDVPLYTRQALKRRYGLWRRETQVQLGLRGAPFDEQAARDADRELAQLGALLDVLPLWIRWGWLTPSAAQELETRTRDRAEVLRERLIYSLPTKPPPYPQRNLDETRFLLQTIQELHAAGRLADDTVYPVTSAELSARIEKLEIDAGLRTPPPSEPPPAPPPAPRPAIPLPALSRKRLLTILARPSHKPWSWDRLWETLLSVRTVRALLFLGVLVFFAGGVSWIIGNWETFAPWVQLIILAGFTALFYALGWYVRVRMALRETGIAISAVASLFVPLDFYAFYLSGGFPQERWAEVWLLASVVCLGAYLLAVYFIQAEFFGYLVGVAAGSTLTALMQVGGVDVDGWHSGLAALALVMALAGEGLQRRERDWTCVMARPLWNVALAAITTILALASGWALAGRATSVTFSRALAADWWLGGLLFALATGRYRLRAVGLAAATCFPIAAFLTQRVLFIPWGIHRAWYALGWTLLVPFYLITGRRLTQREAVEGPENTLHRAYGRGVMGWSAVLITLAALWPMVNLPVAAAIHPLLAATVALAARLWRRPRPLPIASLLLLSGMTLWVVSGGATVAHLGPAWALLAIWHVIVALSLRRSVTRYDAPLYAAGWGLAGLSLLPPLFANSRPVLTYTLGNWIALNGWLAALVHKKQAPGLRAFLQARGLPATVLHWAAALPLLPWVLLAWGDKDMTAARRLWLGSQFVEVRLELIYVLLAWALLALGVRLRRRRWAYSRPWHTTAHLALVAAIVTTLNLLLDGQPASVGVSRLFTDRDQAWAAATLLLAAAFYFTSARVLHQKGWLALGGLAFPCGWLLALNWMGLDDGPLSAALSLVVVAYTGGMLWLEKRRGVQRATLFPLDVTNQIVSAVAFVGGLAPLLVGEGATDAALLWAASSQLILGIGVGLQAWAFNDEFHGHAAAWLGVIAGGLAATAYSQGRGSSAAKAALLAALYVLAERGLYRACVARGVRLRWRPLLRRAWRLYRRPLLVAGWSVSAGAFGLALVRNLWLLGGGRVHETWSIVGLLLVSALYALAAYLFRRQTRVAVRLAWCASALIVAPWTLLTHRGWYLWDTPSAPRHALSWIVLALLALLVRLWLVERFGRRTWNRPLHVVAHALSPVALLWGVADVTTSSWTFGLAVLFYLLAAWGDRRRQPAISASRARFLYPAAALIPVWAVYLLARFAPSAPQTTYGLTLLGFAFPALALGRWLASRERAYRMPLYLVAYGTAIVGTALVAHQRPVFIGALLFDTALAALSAWTFHEPWWVYPATATLPAALLLAMMEWGVPGSRHGWGLIALGGAYLLVTWGLRKKEPYATPVLAAAFALIALGLPPSSQDRLGALVGYGLAALLYGLSAVGLQQPLLMAPAAGLAAVPYWMVVLESGLARADYGMALIPGLLVAFFFAIGLDRNWGQDQPPFPWSDSAGWPGAMVERLVRWWALPWYVVALAGTAPSVILSLGDSARLTLALVLAAGVYGLATPRFRLRGWLLATVIAAQLAALSAIHWAGWWDWVTLAFAPVTWATALIGLALQRRLGERPPLSEGERALWPGWSRPLYAALALDFFVGQTVALNPSAHGAWVSLSHFALLAVLATAWAAPGPAFVAPVLGLAALAQHLNWQEAATVTWPPALALLALLYGLIGCRLRYLRRGGTRLPMSIALWEHPLWLSGALISLSSLGLAFSSGADVPRLALRAIFERPLLQPDDVPKVQMTIAVLALLGLLYLAMALTDRQSWLGYGAVGMLLGVWTLEWLLVRGLREVQWYAIPAGVYLLGTGWVEWRRGGRTLARWIDRAALILLLGSSFWQSLDQNGGRYALLMFAEGLAIGWWGSARRMRRFLYAGVAGVVVDVTRQSVDPLLSANRWIVLLPAGALLIGLAMLTEGRLEKVRALSWQVRKRLEDWE